MAYGHQELPSSAAGGTFFLLFSLADIRFPQALRPNSCMPKAWQPFLRGSPPQENPPSAFCLCVSVANIFFFLKSDFRRPTSDVRSPVHAITPSH